MTAIQKDVPPSPPSAQGANTTATATQAALLPRWSGSYGSLNLNADGSYIYSTDQNAVESLGLGDSATDSFTYTLSDGIDTDLAELSITIKGANEPPIANDDTVDVAENSSISKNAASGLIQANDIDPDGDPLVITAVRIASRWQPTTHQRKTTSIDGTSLTGIYGTHTQCRRLLLL